MLHLLYRALDLLVHAGFQRVLAGCDGASTLRGEDSSGDSTLVEKQGDVLELESLRLRVKEVHHRDKYGVQYREDDKGAPADVVYTSYVSMSFFLIHQAQQNPPNAIGVIFTTANTAIQFHPDAMACIRVRTRVVFSSAG